MHARPLPQLLEHCDAQKLFYLYLPLSQNERLLPNAPHAMSTHATMLRLRLLLRYAPQPHDRLLCLHDPGRYAMLLPEPHAMTRNELLCFVRPPPMPPAQPACLPVIHRPIALDWCHRRRHPSHNRHQNIPQHLRSNMLAQPRQMRVKPTIHLTQQSIFS